MTLRHAQGALRVETLQANEQAVGVPAPDSPQEPSLPATGRDSSGRIADRDTAAQLGRRGAAARWRKARELRVLRGLGLRVVPELLRPYAEDAEQFCAAEVERLARECGGGVCPPNASALVQQGALAMAGSRAAYAAGDLKLGASLGTEVRQCLLAAREITVLEAKSRPQSPASRWLVPAQESTK